MRHGRTRGPQENQKRKKKGKRKKVKAKNKIYNCFGQFFIIITNLKIFIMSVFFKIIKICVALIGI